MLRTLLFGLGAVTGALLARSRAHPSSNREASQDRLLLKQLALTGTLPYTTPQLVLRQERIGLQLSDLFAQAERLGIAPESVFLPDPERRTDRIVAFRDIGSLGEEREEEEDGGAPGDGGEEETPCCTAEEIAAGLLRIKAAYTAAVARVNKWKGCQDWSVIVQAAVGAVLPPCWTGKYVWRINVYPFGRFFPGGDGDTFVHHAYAVCPCNCGGFGVCPDCLVLDPYSVTGLAFFQSADIYPFSEWIADAQVWRATTLPNHDNGTIYGYTMRYYCSRASQGPVQRGICRLVRELLKRELARYTGSSGVTLEALYRQYGLEPDCC